jgi:hypothetical protein
MGEPAQYPGWTEFSGQLKKLVDGVKNDEIPIDNPALKPPPKITKESLARKLVKLARAITADEKCQCEVPKQKVLIEALTKPSGRDYDWSGWSAHWKGKWWRPEGDPLDADTDWEAPETKEKKADDAEGQAGVPSGKEAKKQDAIFRKSGTTEVERRGWNISNAEDYVWGWDPKEYGREWEKAVHVGYPFKNGECQCIIWICSVDAYLECVAPDGKCYSIVALDGHGKLEKKGPPRPAK